MRGALACLAVGVLAAGCGGGVSKSGFISKADAICREALDASYSIDYGSVSPLTPEATGEDLRRFAAGLEEAVVLFREEVRRLRELEPPEDFAEEFGRIVAGLEASLDRTEDAARAARRGDKPGLRAAGKAADALRTEARRAADAYGLEACSA